MTASSQDVDRPLCAQTYSRRIGKAAKEFVCVAKPHDRSKPDAHHWVASDTNTDTARLAMEIVRAERRGRRGGSMVLLPGLA